MSAHALLDVRDRPGGSPLSSVKAYIVLDTKTNQSQKANTQEANFLC